ncbi:Radical SAM domain protein [Stanieria cyanosphaera PCC 7437]|uniref:Radical SAM domain protein n=1 Tax=Stanieria cyanosphaera (strain ATCC 29371 / PCC 7437) TaxID=111780 RepID=K9XQ38_STAC7|nr:radical SAM protein [Stanieria cyanosphaera]AFZ34735.1 Radical SAM domain protein [Stanieria cyanosphaera PCC 7437]
MSQQKKLVKQKFVVQEKLAQADIYKVNAQSILNKATGFIDAYDFTLNPYRGCQYGCSYCYAAAFSPDVNLRQNWGDWVIIKENAQLLLNKELNRWHKKNRDRPATIYMSSVTDPYQPIEAKQKLTRALLTVMLQYQPTLVIQTRSPMIVRDLDLLKQFERLRINLSIPTGSELVKQDFEPRSPSIKARLQTISKLRYSIPCNELHDIRFSVTITPLLPILPQDELEFISKLTVVDRIVIQSFHSSKQKSLVASTRPEAISLKEKYNWWYDNEQESYQRFKQKLTEQLIALAANIEIKEGKEGFGYD